MSDKRTDVFLETAKEAEEERKDALAFLENTESQMRVIEKALLKAKAEGKKKVRI